jgi:hypothetical protein
MTGLLAIAKRAHVRLPQYYIPVRIFLQATDRKGVLQEKIGHGDIEFTEEEKGDMESEQNTPGREVAA